jgi:hypothetical protein
VTKRARGLMPPLPTCPERPHPPPATWPLGWGAWRRCYGGSSGKLQLGNYWEHPSCLLPARELGSEQPGPGQLSSPALPAAPSLAWCSPTEVGRGGKASRRQKQVGHCQESTLSPLHLPWPTLGADQPAWNFFLLLTHTPHSKPVREPPGE